MYHRAHARTAPGSVALQGCQVLQLCNDVCTTDMLIINLQQGGTDGHTLATLHMTN